MPRYVVAVRRAHQAAGLNAEQAVKAVPNVEVVGGSGNVNRILVEAEPSAIAELSRRFGHQLIIEPQILHRRLGPVVN